MLYILTDLLTPYEPEHSLGSSGRVLLVIPGALLEMKGDRAVALMAPRLWNKLPEELRLAKSVSSFKSQIALVQESVLIMSLFCVLFYLLLDF